MAAGRPSEYDAERIGKDISTYIEECKAHSYLPTVEGLAVHLSVGRTTIYRWREEHDEFRNILEQILALQASMLIQNGLKGEFNSTITKLMLSKHKGEDGQPYTDKSDITSGGQPITPMTDGDRAALTELRDLLKQRAA
jgi:hypothetical protein